MFLRVNLSIHTRAHPDDGPICNLQELLALADEMGIVITHDFMFGDQFYPVDAWMLTDVAAEVRHFPVQFPPF